MAFVKPENFTKRPIIKEAINHISHETGYEKKLIETILDDFFVSVKILMIQTVANSFKLINFGRFVRRKSPVEKAEIQLLKEQRLREQRLNEISNE